MGLKKAVTKKVKQTAKKQVKKKITQPVKKQVRQAVSTYCKTCRRNRPPGHTCKVGFTERNAARRRKS